MPHPLENFDLPADSFYVRDGFNAVFLQNLFVFLKVGWFDRTSLSITPMNPLPALNSPNQPTEYSNTYCWVVYYFPVQEDQQPDGIRIGTLGPIGSGNHSLSAVVRRATLLELDSKLLSYLLQSYVWRARQDFYTMSPLETCLISAPI